MRSETVSRYIVPSQWVKYDGAAIFGPLVRAKTAAGVLNRMPYLPRWIEQLHEEQLKLEAVGTSRIEGAEFTERERDEALALGIPGSGRLTHSQRQLRSANSAYRWMREQPAERPVTSEFILNIHRLMVSGCDDDHCEPGALRPDGWNVTFGSPPCRGAEGGAACRKVFGSLCAAISSEFRSHDPIIQAIASHYHIGAMHPFGDGNGRTARALEAFMMRRAGVNNMVMVSLSNYYYEHKDEYLTALYESRRRGHDLTPFLQFALRAVEERCGALAGEIASNHRRLLFREFARSLFEKLRNPRRRALGRRQMGILEILLDGGPTGVSVLAEKTFALYSSLKLPARALARDLGHLLAIEAITIDGEIIDVDLGWPEKLSESEMLERYERTPSSKHPDVANLSRLLRHSRRT